MGHEIGLFARWFRAECQLTIVSDKLRGGQTMSCGSVGIFVVVSGLGVMGGVAGCGKEATNILLSVDDGMPCAVAAVVRGNCQRCHAEQPLFGAPMPLTSAPAFRNVRSAQDPRNVFEG